MVVLVHGSWWCCASVSAGFVVVVVIVVVVAVVVVGEQVCSRGRLGAREDDAAGIQADDRTEAYLGVAVGASMQRGG